MLTPNGFIFSLSKTVRNLTGSVSLVSTNLFQVAVSQIRISPSRLIAINLRSESTKLR